MKKGVLKIYSKFTGEQPCRSATSIKLQSNLWKDASVTKAPGLNLGKTLNNLLSNRETLT